jgi:hypothetical protein
MWYDEIGVRFQNIDTILGSIIQSINPLVPLNKINMKWRPSHFFYGILNYINDPPLAMYWRALKTNPTFFQIRPHYVPQT